MKASALLRELRAQDVHFERRGDRLRVHAPHGVLTEELCAILGRLKPDILLCLGEETLSGAPRGCTAHSAEQVASMSLDEFAGAGLVVRVASTVLGREVLFVSDNVPESSLLFDGTPVYRAAELRKLAVLEVPPRALQCIHEIKSLFQGEISHVRNAD